MRKLMITLLSCTAIIGLISCSISIDLGNSTPAVIQLDGGSAQTTPSTQVQDPAATVEQPAQPMANPLGQPANTEEPIPTQQSMEERIRNARVLVFEDVRATSDLVPFVHRALGNLGIQNVVEVGDATGNFQDQIYSTTEWDLIIVAAEVHTAFRGEMFDGIVEHMDKGAGVIIELWYLDSIINGKIAPIMNRCGLGWQQNITRSPGDDPFKFSYVWLDSSDPLLSNPNTANAPSYPYPYWVADAGDFIKLKPGSESKLLAGVYRDTKDSYGVVASCLDGRVYLQTFCSHDYPQNNMIALWENYIVNALTNHFNHLP